MTKVYSRCYDEIGAFNDTRYIVGMLEKVSCVVNVTQYNAYDKKKVWYWHKKLGAGYFWNAFFKLVHSQLFLDLAF